MTTAVQANCLRNSFLMVFCVMNTLVVWMHNYCGRQ